MLDILSYVAIALAGAVAIVLILASRRPDTFRTARSAIIDAAPEKIFPLINDLRAMNVWNPFANTDPNMKGSYSGPAAGSGAVFTFEGRKSGTGNIEITKAAAPQRTDMRLVMTKPFKCDNTIAFTLEPQGGATKVTWEMSGKQIFMGKVMGLFIDCDKMCADQFDKGLADLKAIAEKA